MCDGPEASARPQVPAGQPARVPLKNPSERSAASSAASSERGGGGPPSARWSARASERDQSDSAAGDGSRPKHTNATRSLQARMEEALRDGAKSGKSKYPIVPVPQAAPGAIEALKAAGRGPTVADIDDDDDDEEEAAVPSRAAPLASGLWEAMKASAEVDEEEEAVDVGEIDDDDDDDMPVAGMDAMMSMMGAPPKP